MEVFKKPLKIYDVKFLEYKKPLLMNQNTTWISTIPRTGSMWTTNVVREIYKYSKKNVLPKIQLKNKNDWLNLFQKAYLDYNLNNHYVLKVHVFLDSNVPRSKVITNIRNPYDVCASYYQFMNCDLNLAISVALDILKMQNHYEKFNKNKLFVIRYEDIEELSIELILELSKFLSVSLNESEAESILEKFSRENVNIIIANNDKALSDTLSKKLEIDPRKIVNLGKNNYRSFDPDTGFQTGHISERKTGEWKLHFSESEIEKIIENIDNTALKLGYCSERK